MDDTEIDVSALKRLMEMIDGDEEDFAEFVSEFNDIAPKLVADMQAAMGRSDWDKMRIAAHTLKSNARDMGANRLSEMAGAIETHCKQAPEAISAEMIHQIEAVQLASLSNLAQIRFEQAAP